MQAHSWIGRTGNGYRFDYFHVGAGSVDRVDGCGYLHEPREQKLTDHAAVALTLACRACLSWLTTPSGSGQPVALF